jgi:chloramphenicol 3-O-phosphotransferase
MTQGTIIFLNGTSSSGKTSIARALQKSLDEPYLYLSVDSFLDMLPEQCFSGEEGESVGAAQQPLEPTTLSRAHIGGDWGSGSVVGLGLSR